MKPTEAGRQEFRVERLVGQLRAGVVTRNPIAGMMLMSSAPTNALMREAADQIERLSAVAEAARRYYDRYAQDEAEDVEDCVCGREQHEDAKALRNALSFLRPNENSSAKSAE